MVMVSAETLRAIDGDHEARLAAVRSRESVKDARIAELEAFVLDLMTAHGPGTLASEELFERGAALARTIQR